MKKFLIFLTFLWFPFNVLAYSNEVYLGGNTIGIDIKSTGVIVIGFYKIEGNYPTTDLVEGDIIIAVNDKKVTNINELSKVLEDNVYDNQVNITYLRDNKMGNTTLKLVQENNMYKTGLYVKDNISGIGTLTFIDPEDNTYGALGHEIVEVNTSKVIDVKTGRIFENSITSIDSSRDGKPGSKNAKFYYQNLYGDIKKNTKYGIYGTYEAYYDKNNLIAVAEPEEVKVGKATIYTVLSNEKVEEFTINITKINEKSETKNIAFEITDKRLLDKTGGIVQGMSGSPIVQNGKLIGAVTHVITDNVKTGYGVFITTMLKESDK